jgi:hypothetical protein
LPGWRIHEYIDWALFGRTYPKVHRAIDEPYKYFGRSHRILFHDCASAYLIAEEFYPGDPDAKSSGYSHIYLDEICSENPWYKRHLEKMELLTRKQRKRDQTERKREERAMKKDPVLGRFLDYMKKMEEIRRLWLRLHS